MSPFTETEAAILRAVQTGPGTTQLPDQLTDHIDRLDQHCFELLPSSVIRSVAHSTEPSYKPGIGTQTTWQRLHITLYEKLSTAAREGIIFTALHSQLPDPPQQQQQQPIHDSLHDASQTALAYALLQSPALHRLLSVTQPYLFRDDPQISFCIPKLVHLWLLLSYSQVTTGQQNPIALDTQWVLQEGDAIVQLFPPADAIVARLLYHFIEKHVLAERMAIKYVSVLEPCTGEWRVHNFLQTPFEADYAAAFERCLDPNSKAYGEPSLVEIFARMLPEQIEMQRRINWSIEYCLEVLFAFVLRITFYVYAAWEYIRGWAISYQNHRVAKEMFVSAFAHYKSWRQRNALLDNRRYRGVGPIEYGTPVSHRSLPPQTRSLMRGYDRQGMVLYQRCSIASEVTNAMQTVRWKRYYGETAARYHLIGSELREVLMRMACIEYTADGGTVSSPALVMIYAWLYVVGAVILSVIVGVKNWGNRDNVLERISDTIWVATTLLISVFGITKLASEDPQAIRHALSGRMGLMNARHVYEFLRISQLDDELTWEDTLKGVAAVFPGKVEWLSEYETAFCDRDRIGDIRLGGGFPVRALPAIIGLPCGNGFANVVLGKFRKTEQGCRTEWLQVKEQTGQLEVDTSPDAKRMG